MGYDAGTGERNLKRWDKGVSKTARKCGQAMFMEQTASRVTIILQFVGVTAVERIT
jgi:hypothetical protein